MDTSNTVQIIISSPAFAKLAETWFKKTKNEIIKIFLFVERATYFNTGILVTLVVLRVTNPEASFAGIVRVSLFLSSIVGILAVLFGCIFFDRFVSKFNQLLEYLHINTEDKEDLKQLQDFGFLKAKTKEAIKRWHGHYFNECNLWGPISKEAVESGKSFSKKYKLLRKFGLVDMEIEIYMKNNPQPAFIA